MSPHHPYVGGTRVAMEHTVQISIFILHLQGKLENVQYLQQLKLFLLFFIAENKIKIILLFSAVDFVVVQDTPKTQVIDSH